MGAELTQISGLDATLVTFLFNHGAAAILISSFLIAETAIVTASALSVAGYLSITDVFIFSIIGSVLADFFWFIVGPALIKVFPPLQRKSEIFFSLKIFKKIDKHLFLFLLFLQFFYGARLILIIYMGVKKMNPLVFLFINGVSTFFLVSGLYGIGWLIGNGIVNLLSEFRATGIILTTVFISTLVVIAYKKIGKRVEEKIVGEKDSVSQITQ